MTTRPAIKNYLWGVGLLAVAALLIMTNPDEQAHKQALLSGGFYDTPLIGKLFGDVDYALNAAKYKSYFLYSVVWAPDGKWYSIGVLGNIIVSDGAGGKTVKR